MPANINSTNQPKAWYKKWWGLIIVFFLSLIFIIITALIFYFFNILKAYRQINSDNSQLVNQLLASEIYEAEGKNSFWAGSASPKVTIVEFADFNCPLCGNAYSKIREISLKYKKDVKIVYRDFPVYENSVDLSLAARCAGEQGAFWLMHDKLFQNQGNFKIEQLPELAKQIGVDEKKFNSCLSEEKYLNDIKNDFTEAESLGVTGTPTWFINGRKLPGDIPYQLLIQIIDGLLE